MRPGTRRAFHFGINYLLAPLPALDVGHFLSFEQQLAQGGLVFDRRERGESKIVLLRENTPLQVTVGQAGPPLCQFLMVAPQPKRLLDEFSDEAVEAFRAYREVWPGPLQVVRRDCTLRHLYQADADHAFQFIWEQWLQQSEQSLQTLGRNVQGGGIRIVMPQQEPGEPTVELRVESFMQDTTQIFTEAQFVWQQPRAPGEEPDPKALLEEVEAFAEGPLIEFVQAARGGE